MNLAFPAQDRQSEKSEPTGPENLDSGSDSRPRSAGICPEDIGQYFCFARAWDPEAGDDIAGPASIPRIERGNRFHESFPSRVRHANEEAGIGRALARIERDPGINLKGLTGFVFLRSEEHTSELQSQSNLVCRLLLFKKVTKIPIVSQLFFIIYSSSKHSKDCYF